MLIKQGVIAVIKPVVKYFLTWDEAFQSGVQQAGGKGWNLGRLARYGFKIPMGGVLLPRLTTSSSGTTGCRT